MKIKTFEVVKEDLLNRGVAFEEITFSDIVQEARTTDTSIDHNYNPTNGIKTLIIKTKTGLQALILRGSDSVDQIQLKSIVGKWSIASAVDLANTLGFLPGDVCPLVLDISIIIDKKTLGLLTWSIGAGDSQKGFNVTVDEALKHISSYNIVDISKPLVTNEPNMMQNHPDLLTRRVQQILPSKEGLETLMTKRKIRLYMGFDPSRPNLHIGHLVGLLQLKAFQEAGHEVIFLIGDFTGMIGDPTDKGATRPKLSHEEVLKNAETYKEQAGKFLRFTGENAVKIMFNYDWNSKLNFPDVLELASNLTVQQLIERDMFQVRIKDGKPIHLHEFLYPLIQGYDSVAMDVDLEIGGNDQMFNLLMGRTLLKALKNKEKFCLTTKLLVDSSGKKVGKTTGNAVDLFGKPEDLFGGLMAVPDDAIENMLVCATEIPLDQVAKLVEQIAIDPMEVKKKLAWEITKMCHNEHIADTAQSHFETVVQGGKAPATIGKTQIKPGAYTALELVISCTALENISKSQIKRLIQEGAIEINDKKITKLDEKVTIVGGEILKFGKRNYIEISTNL